MPKSRIPPGTASTRTCRRAIDQGSARPDAMRAFARDRATPLPRWDFNLAAVSSRASASHTECRCRHVVRPAPSWRAPLLQILKIPPHTRTHSKSPHPNTHTHTTHTHARTHNTPTPRLAIHTLLFSRLPIRSGVKIRRLNRRCETGAADDTHEL